MEEDNLKENVFSSLLVNYQLTIDNCNREISDEHLQEISQSHCGQWRSLPSHLKMPTITSDDVDRETSHNEEEKRLKFFKKWKQERGSDATYKELIHALITIKCRQDAEVVCKVLKKSLPAPLHQSNVAYAANFETERGESDTGV